MTKAELGKIILRIRRGISEIQKNEVSWVIVQDRELESRLYRLEATDYIDYRLQTLDYTMLAIFLLVQLLLGGQ